MLQHLLCLLLVVLFAAPAGAAASAPQPATGKAVPVGDFVVVPLLDGERSFPYDPFRGADEAAMRKAAGGLPSIPASFTVFLIKHGKDRFLIDTGNGALLPERSGQLLLCLQAAQTAPADISKIFITHLHGDHVGGLVKDGKPAFPRAKVYVAKAEYDYWVSDEAMRQAPENRRGLLMRVRDVLRVLDQNALWVFFTPGDVVFPGLASVALPGHTPGHTGFMLASGGTTVFFVGDLLHGAALQMPRPDITIDFDVDQPKAKETRLRAFKRLAQDATPIAGTHLPFPGIGVVRQDGEGYRLEPLKQE